MHQRLSPHCANPQFSAADTGTSLVHIPHNHPTNLHFVSWAALMLGFSTQRLLRFAIKSYRLRRVLCLRPLTTHRGEVWQQLQKKACNST